MQQFLRLLITCACTVVLCFGLSGSSRGWSPFHRKHSMSSHQMADEPSCLDAVQHATASKGVVASSEHLRKCMHQGAVAACYQHTCALHVLLQDDNFMPTMTVLETCSYFATLTLPRKWTKHTRKDRITEVLAAMGLSHTLNTLVGTSMHLTAR